MSKIYSRTALAARMADQLIHPGVLDEGLRSGLFLSGMRRTGKTTFLVNDLIPALEREGALVIYVDLWSDAHANPATLVLEAIRRTMRQLQTPGSSVLAGLARVTSLDAGALSFKFGFKLEKIGEPGGVTLAQALSDLVDQARANVVLIVDEVQHAMTSDAGTKLLLAVKAARDAINARPGSPGHFLFVGTGSHRAMVSELTARRSQAFAGAISLPFPELGEEYVDHLLERLAGEDYTALPSRAAANAAFQVLGNRPEELGKALRQLQLHLPPGGDADAFLRVIASTLRSADADVELAKVEQLGALAVAVFDRIAAADEGASGLFSAESAAAYSAAIGREVRVEEVQPIVNELMAANVVVRRAHGLYGVTDPYVQEGWRARKNLAV